MSIDLLVRKLSDNSTYYIVSNILGFNMGVNKYLIENKDANFYRFRNYTGNSSEIHEDFNRTRNGKYIDSKILFNNNSSIISNTKEVSMLENIKVSQAIESDEYIYYCEPNYENLNAFFDKQQGGANINVPMNSSRMHQFLFPVYVDNSTNDTAGDFNIFRDFDIEINYGRNKIKTLEDFKIGYSFEYTLGTYDYTSMEQVSSPRYIDGRGFNFFKRDDLGSGARVKRNVNIIGEKYSDWSRCRNSRGNRAYKYKITATKYGENHGTVDTTNNPIFGTFYEYRIHTDMIYGHGAESIHPYYSGDEFVANTYEARDFLYGANYSYNSVIPTMPTMYVDFIDVEDNTISVDTTKIHTIYSENLKLVGFIRLRMYSWLDIELNAGVLQKYYGDNKVPLRQWVNYNLKTEDYFGRFNAVSELTNTEGFTVKFTFDKRRPQYKYTRNTAAGKSVYMLPTSVFENIISKDKDLDIIYGTDKTKGLLYTYADFDKFADFSNIGFRWMVISTITYERFYRYMEL